MTQAIQENVSFELMKGVDVSNIYFDVFTQESIRILVKFNVIHQNAKKLSEKPSHRIHDESWVKALFVQGYCRVLAI